MRRPQVQLASTSNRVAVGGRIVGERQARTVGVTRADVVRRAETGRGGCFGSTSGQQRRAFVERPATPRRSAFSSFEPGLSPATT